MKILFIINPILEQRLGIKIKDLLADTLNPVLFDPSIAYSDFSGHARKLARESRDSFHVIVAAGGDGTVNEIASQLTHSKVILGILPMGSGKGLARSLNIPMNINKAIQTLNDFTVIEIDTGLANEFRFINIAGIGFDAAVAHAYAGASGRGFTTYAWQTIRSLLSYQSIPAELKVGGRHIFTHAFLICFANSSQWGYGARISPHASTSDGILDLCIWRDFPRILSPFLLVRLFSGAMHHSRFTDILPIREADICGQGKHIGHIDGEPVEFSMPLHIRVDPASLRVITGRQPARNQTFQQDLVY